MGVGHYSVSCGYGYGCGFGGFTSLIAMVLALHAREALRMGGSLRMVMGGKVFSGSSLSWLARRCAAPCESLCRTVLCGYAVLANLRKMPGNAPKKLCFGG